MPVREPIIIKRAPSSPIQGLMAAPRPTLVSLSGYRPSFASSVFMPSVNYPRVPQLPVFSAHRKNGLGQNSLVTVNPKVDLTISTGLEKYMFPVGLMAGGAASFLVGSVIPESFRPVTTVIGLGLLGWGVYTLIKGGTAAPAAPAGPTPPPSGATPTTASPQAFQPPTTSAFNTLQIQVVTPQPDQTIAHLGGLFSSDRIPIVMSLFNPSSETVTFNLQFEWDEFPTFAGVNRGPNHGSQSFQVTLGPNEEKNQTFELPYQSSGFGTSSMGVSMAVYKKRTPNEAQQLVTNITFNVT